jgi:hypothetical protein
MDRAFAELPNTVAIAIQGSTARSGKSSNVAPFGRLCPICRQLLGNLSQTQLNIFGRIVSAD